MSMDSETVTVQEAAVSMGVDDRTITVWIKEGRLQSVKQGRRRLIPRSSLESLRPNNRRNVAMSLNRSYVNGWKVPRGFDQISTYEELTEYTKKFAQSRIKFLLLLGSPGSGKTQQLKSDLAGLTHAWIENHATPLALYCSAYRATNTPIVLDDIDHFFKNAMACSLMKSLTQTDKTRTVSWQSTGKVLQSQNVPAQFETSSAICLIANKWNDNDPNMAAIQDRAMPVAFFPSAETIHERVRKLGWCPTDVWEFVGKHLADIPEPSMREYRHGMDWQANKMKWQEKLLKLWGRQ